MQRIKVFLQALFCIYLLLISESGFSCACFNFYHLQTLFINQPNVSCQMNTQGIIVMVLITNGKDIAYSNPERCEIRALYHNISRQYAPFSNENSECINELMTACQNLGVPVINNNL